MADPPLSFPTGSFEREELFDPVAESMASRQSFEGQIAFLAQSVAQAGKFLAALLGERVLVVCA